MTSAYLDALILNLINDMNFHIMTESGRKKKGKQTLETEVQAKKEGVNFERAVKDRLEKLSRLTKEEKAEIIEFISESITR